MFQSLFLCCFLLGPQYDLRVGTFNCEFMNRQKVHIKYGFPYMLENEDLALWNQEGFREARFQRAAAQVARAIHKIGADVIVLTEAGPKDDVADLVRAVKEAGTEYPYFFVSDSTNASFQHVAVLSKFPMELIKDKIPGRAFYDPEPDDPEEEREAFVMKGIHVSVQAHGKTIHVIGTHLPSERNGHDQDTMRIAVAQLIRRYSYPIIESGAHVIIAGDLNDERGQPAIRMIRGKEDMYEDLVQTGHISFFHPSEWKNRWTYMFKGQRNQLDQILISRSLLDACHTLEEGGIRGRVLPMDIQHKPSLEHLATSDHKPFVLDFRFR